MRFQHFLAGAVFALLATHEANAQSGLEKVGSVSWPTGPKVSIKPIFQDGLVYLAETDTSLPYGDWKTRLVRLDPAAGKAAPVGDLHLPPSSEPLLATPRRLIVAEAEEWKHERKFQLYALPSFENLTDIQLRDKLLDAMDQGRDLLLLQPDWPMYGDASREAGMAVVRFDANDLTYRGMTKLPLLDMGMPAVFHDGGVVGTRRRQDCSEDMVCLSLRSMTLEGVLKAEVDFKAAKSPGRNCSEDGKIYHARDLILVAAGCKFYAFGSDLTQLRYVFADTGGPYQPPVIADGFIIAPDFSNPKPGSSLRDIRVFDRSSGVLVTTLELPWGQLYGSGDKVFRATANNNSYLIEIYRINAAAIRKSAN